MFFAIFYDYVLSLSLMNNFNESTTKKQQAEKLIAVLVYLLVCSFKPLNFSLTCVCVFVCVANALCDLRVLLFSLPTLIHAIGIFYGIYRTDTISTRTYYYRKLY